MKTKENEKMNEDELKCYRRGYNWHIMIRERHSEDGDWTVITNELLFKSKYGLAKIISNYPSDEGKIEDAAYSDLCDAYGWLRMMAHEQGEDVIEDIGWLRVHDSIHGELVQGFINILRGRSRVYVEIISETSKA